MSRGQSVCLLDDVYETQLQFKRRRMFPSRMFSKVNNFFKICTYFTRHIRLKPIPLILELMFPTSNMTCIIINVLLFYQTFLRTANAIIRPTMDNEEDEVSVTAIILLFYRSYKLVLHVL